VPLPFSINKNFSMNNKKTRTSGRVRWMLSLFVVLTLGAGFVPAFRAHAANLSPSTFSAVGLAYSFAGSHNLLPRSMAIFAPDEGDGADLTVTKTVNSENVAADSDVTYTIEVRNIGPDASFNAQMKDVLPAGMTFVSLAQNSGPTFSCSTPLAGDPGEVNCSVSSLDSNGVATFTLKTHVTANVEPGTFFTNIATVTADTFDPSDENNSSSAVTSVKSASADVSVAKTTTSSTVRPDADITYNIEVRNGGTDAAENVELDDTLPGTMTFVSLTQNSGPTFSCTPPAVGSGGTITCKIASLPAGSAAVFTLTGHVPSDTSTDTTFENTATVSTDTPDASEENNSSIATTIVATCDAEYIVTTNADSGAGSLRQAIFEICPGGVIFFDTNVVSNIMLTSGELVINKNLRIQGPGANRLNVGRSAAANFRIFNINAGGVVNINGLTASNGNVAGNGGGVNNDGTLVINSSIISNNHADAGSGGGIFNQGTLTIINSAITGNTASDSGGIQTNAGSLNIINSTISGNSATGFGGGIQPLGGFVALTNVTVTNNHADSNNDGSGMGGGVMASFGLILRNTIVAGNYKGSGNSTPDDISGSVAASSSFNLIGTGGDGGLTNANGNQINVVNPGLGALANNGGATPTHALLKGSPALDAGSNTLLPADTFDLDNDGNTGEPLPVDQRGIGFLRVADSADADTAQTVDIGAYEAQVSIEDITDKTTAEDTPLSFSFNVGDATLINSVTATSSNTTLVPNSNLSITGAGSSRTLQISPAADISGNTTITVTVAGGSGQTMSDTFVLNVTAVNDAPQAVNDSYSTSENTPLNVTAPGVLSNDTDVDNSTLTAVKVSNPSNGSVALNSNGSFLYTPNAGFSGTDSFTYKANDGSADSNTATVSITVNEGGTLAFSSTTYAADESAANAIITITRTGGTGGTATVLFQTSNGTASAADYTSVSQTVTFANGESSKTINVPITNDSNDETDETINLTLTSAGGSGQLGTPSTAVLTITDDDAAPGVSINDVSVTEGNSGTTNAVFNVTLSAPSDFTVKVDYATSNGTATAGTDYVAASGTLTFNAGVTTQTVTVQVNGDNTNEPNETFFVNLSNALNATVTDNQGLGTILNDDSPGVQFSANAYSFSEGAGHGDIVVNRTGDLSLPLTVDYITSDQSGTTPCQTLNTGIASDRCDYATAAGTLSFAAGQSSLTIPLVLINDAYVEGAEQLSIKLSNPQGGALGSVDTSAITITDNDTQAATQNPIDGLDFFLRQLYIDFLGREPDAGGFQFWKSRMSGSCPADQTCDRVDTALKFFNSDEFRERGYFVYVFYHASLGRRPTYSEWIMDVSKLNGFKTVQEQAAAKEAFISEFMSRQEFMNLYNGAQTGQSFVDALIQKSAVTPGSKQTLINNYASIGRAKTLRAFMETPEVQAAFIDRAFVSMLYFGLLRRNAENEGFIFWMQRLIDTNHNYGQLIGGFLNSDEYRFRFAQIPLNSVESAFNDHRRSEGLNSAKGD
jgi:uncharacterized repeat protein (TIGR01451 family)